MLYTDCYTVRLCVNLHESLVVVQSAVCNTDSSMWLLHTLLLQQQTEHRKLKKRLRRRNTRYQSALEHSKAALSAKISADRMLTEQAVSVTVTGRMKELYSLWSKMVKHNRTLDQIQDVVALRVSKCL
jgi:(p)ppGpp synthase/HD superfamily hydrolase